MEQILFFYFIPIILSIGIRMKLLEMVFGHSSKDIPCDIPGICTLVYVNQYITDKRPFHFIRSS